MQANYSSVNSTVFREKVLQCVIQGMHMKSDNLRLRELTYVLRKDDLNWLLCLIDLWTWDGRSCRLSNKAHEWNPRLFLIKMLTSVSAWIHYLVELFLEWEKGVTVIHEYHQHVRSEQRQKCVPEVNVELLVRTFLNNSALLTQWTNPVCQWWVTTELSINPYHKAPHTVLLYWRNLCTPNPTLGTAINTVDSVDSFDSFTWFLRTDATDEFLLKEIEGGLIAWKDGETTAFCTGQINHNRF